MQRNVGENGAGQGATLLFVGSASYTIGISRGTSRGVGNLVLHEHFMVRYHHHAMQR
jgi:hypothetical protein